MVYSNFYEWCSNYLRVMLNGEAAINRSQMRYSPVWLCDHWYKFMPKTIKFIVHWNGHLIITNWKWQISFLFKFSKSHISLHANYPQRHDMPIEFMLNLSFLCPKCQNNSGLAMCFNAWLSRWNNLPVHVQLSSVIIIIISKYFQEASFIVIINNAYMTCFLTLGQLK